MSKIDASQQQGSFAGGIDGRVHQFTVSGSSSSRADQHKRQRMSAPPGSSQQQYDPISCCGLSSQDGGSGNSEEIQQSSSQDASDANATQNSLLTGSSRSTEDGSSCSVKQKASNNFDTGGNSYSAAPCPAVVVTTSCYAFGSDGEESPANGDCTEDTPPVFIVPDDCTECSCTICINSIDGSGNLNALRLGRQNR